jgi:hypothetical protein
MQQESTGIAVAKWYRHLHAAGFKALENQDETLNYLEAWAEMIEPKVLVEVGTKLGFAAIEGWKLAVSQCEALKARYKSFPQTFNYNDFAVENLALSCAKPENLEAIVYDYDQFSIGTVYSDWRNVIYSLRGRGCSAFMDAYGGVREIEGVLDDALSILHGLISASRRDLFPKWAVPLRESVENGELEKKVAAALVVV